MVQATEIELGNRFQQQQHQNSATRRFEPLVIRTSSNFESIFNNKIVAGPCGPTTNSVRVLPLPRHQVDRKSAGSYSAGPTRSALDKHRCKGDAERLALYSTVPKALTR